MDREKTSAEVHELRRLSDLITVTETDSGIKGIIFDYGGTLDSRGDHWSHIILDAYRGSGRDITISKKPMSMPNARLKYTG